MYTNDQMTDFRRSCCGNDLTKSSVVGCDKTFNLGPLHLTMTVFKQHSVTRMATNDNPILGSDVSAWQFRSFHVDCLLSTLGDRP